MTKQDRQHKIGLKYFPARMITVSVDVARAHQLAAVAMGRHRYTLREQRTPGIAFFQYGTPGRAFVWDIIGFDAIAFFRGLPSEWAHIAVWTEPVADGTQIGVSLLEGLTHRNEVRSAIDDLIEDFRAEGALVRVSEPLSGFDLPADSPGQVRPKRKRKLEREAQRTSE
jgi:hypothetical protein